ncbi:MAG TPA: hypothetical protein VLT62_16005 [Candidatus Methylomirabilis sp.]|nr:hypothetical protein [Candidatus Methylomirabilis sp.]
MRGWRLWAMLLALLAFVLAAAASGHVSPDSFAGRLLGAWLPRIGSTAFFWAGVGLFLLAVWGRGGT